MNRQDLTALLDCLPDEWIESAAEPKAHKRIAFRAFWIAACFAVLIAAAVYPRLRTDPPERIETSVSSQETTIPPRTEPATSDTTAQTESVTSLPETEHAADTAVTVPVSETSTVSAEITQTHTTARDTSESSQPTAATTATISMTAVLTAETIRTEERASTAFSETTVQSTLSETSFTVSYWSEAVPEQDTAPSNTLAYSQFSLSAAVYTEAVPDLPYFPKQPEIDTAEFDAVLITATFPCASAFIRSGTLQPDGGLLLFVSGQPPFTPEIRSTRHFLISVPKLCHVDGARVTAIFEMETTEEQYRRAESEPLTFSGYISTD